jgi:hypothetical protein
MEIAVLNSSPKLAPGDFPFLVEACRLQLLEFCAAWNLDPWAVAPYASAADLPASDVFIFEYVDKLDVDGALAYHSVDALGRPYGRMLPPADPLDATDLSHEALETMGDPTADRWVKRPDGSEVAVEVCDPVQGDPYDQPATVLGETRQIKASNYVLPPFFDPAGVAPFDRLGNVRAPFGMSPGGYEVAATVLGETRQIKVSNFVLPPFFDPAGVAPFDRLGNVTAPFSMSPRGYEAVLDASGNEHDIFAYAVGTVPAHKLRDSGSRLMRRLRGRAR